MKNTFKKFLSILLSAIIVFSTMQVVGISVFANETSYQVWSGDEDSNMRGSGSSSDPFLIDTAEQLAYLIREGGAWNGHYKLTTDIYLNDISKIDWKTGTVESGYTPKQWYTTANSAGSYAIIDGDGHTVYGLYSTGGESAGLVPQFTQWNSNYAMSISNLGVDKAYISATSNAAVFAGSCNYNNTVNFTNCYAGEEITVSAPTAAVITAIAGGSVAIDRCYSLATISENNVYGVVGDTWGGGISISNSYFAKTIVTSKTGNSVPCTNVYLNSGTGVKGESTAYVISEENMQGKDALTSVNKMSGLADYGFVATSGYPVLGDFPYEDSGDDSEPSDEPDYPVWDGSENGNMHGSGSSADPFLIETAEQLAYLIQSGGAWNGHYKLTNDIYLNDISKINWKTGTVANGYTPKQWYTTANSAGSYAIIDGDGYTVYGLYSTGGESAGLVPQFTQYNSNYTMSISNLGVDKAYISATSNAAVFAGSCNYNNTVNFTNCYAGEDVTVIAPTASVITAVAGGSVAINKCYSLATISENNVYGVVGDTWGGGISISNSYFAKTIVTSKTGNSVPCTNVYLNSSTGVKGESTAYVISEENMQGKDVLTSSDKMLGLASTGAFVATETYPILKAFFRGEVVVETKFWDETMVSAPTEGIGTEASPFLIKNAEQLAYVVLNGGSGYCYKLTNDIYLNDVDSIIWSDGSSLNGYVPTQWFDSSIVAPFNGTIDGNGHVVYGLYAKDLAGDVALFPALNNSGSAVFVNLGVDKAYISTPGDAAAFAANCGWESSRITSFSRCYAGEDVYISGKNAAVFYASGASELTIKTCYSIATVTGTNHYGLIGDCWVGTKKITDTYVAKTCISTKTGPSATCEKVYAMQGTGGISMSSTADENMKGEDVLTSSSKMPLLDICDEFRAKSGYPILKIFEDGVPEYVEDLPEVGTDFVYGDTLYATDFEDETIGELPAGWQKGYPGNGASFGWGVENYEARKLVANVVENNTYGKVLHFCSTGTDAFISLPETASIDYIYEATVIINHSTDNTAGIGLTSNMWGGVNNADGTMYTAIFTNNSDGLSYYNYRGTGGAVSQQFALPNNAELPKSGEKITLKLISYNQTSYLYVNDEYAVKIPNRSGGTSSDWVGFYTFGGDFLITDVSVKAIMPITDIKDNNEVIDSYTETFDSIDTLPTGWQSGYNGNGANFGYVNSNGTPSVITNVIKEDGVLEIEAVDVEGFVSLPKIFSRNYIFEANVTVEDASTFGVINNLWNNQNVQLGGINNADSGVYCEIYTDENSDDKELAIKVISYSGCNYVYANNVFLAAVPHREGDSVSDWVGFYLRDGKIKVDDIKIDTLSTAFEALQIGGTQISYADRLGSQTSGSNGIRFNASLDLENNIYKNASNVEFGFVAKISDEIARNAFSINSDSVFDLKIQQEPIVNQNTLDFNIEITGISDANKDKFFNVRAYMAVTVGEDKIYYYSPMKAICPSYIADRVYKNVEDEEVKNAVCTVYKAASKFIGENMSEIKFLLFSDFHYKQGMYISSVADMNALMDKANSNNCDFALSSGDMCNDFKGSPELLNAFLNNKYNLPVYNVYGNHELESEGNTMQIVTPQLTNDTNVVWGTEDGKIGDGSIGYYYFDKNGFRVINLDNNYSYNAKTGEWEHNKPASYGPPAANLYGSSLGPVQQKWFEEVLYDAAEKGLSCIVNGHESYSGVWDSAPEAAAIRELYAKVNDIRSGTVLVSINGHFHTNRQAVVENVLYIDINTTRNTWWQGEAIDHYTSEHTFEFVQYDDEGNPVSTTDYSVGYLSMGKNTWFSADPLSAVVTVNKQGEITMEGQKSDWLGGVVPTTQPSQYVGIAVPEISSGEWDIAYDK